MQKVTVIGLGYIGLPTAAMFAANGVSVLGVDVKKEVCDLINEGQIHIEEPYLADLVKQAVIKGNLHCSCEVTTSENYIIAVPTPITADKKADLSFVVAAGEAVSKVLQKGQLVILESTVSPRCMMDVLKPVLEKNGLVAGEDFYFAYCPERVLPGKILFELEHNNRIIGGINEQSAIVARDLYNTFVKGEIFLTDTTTAEVCKLVENTFRDVNIALANELAKICEKLGCSVWDVIKYANKHPRVNLHQPGPGVGGHCIAVDPWFIVQSMDGYANIIELARKTNDAMPEFVKAKIEKIVEKGSKIVVLGCTYKADVDDIRESPMMEIISILSKDYTVEVVDPHVKQYNTNVYEAVNNADLVVLGVNHKQFKNISFEVMSKVMRGKNFLDTRNFCDKELIKKSGFKYHLLGGGGEDEFITCFKE